MYIDVIIPLGVEGLFTYSVPEEWRHAVAAGSLVVVPFAGHKRYTGVVYAVHAQKPEGIGVRSIDRVVEKGFALSEKHLRFLMWIGEYYLSSPGEVIRAALPVAMRLESYTVVTPADPLPEGVETEGLQREVMQLMQPGCSLSIAEMERCMKVENLLPVIKSLLEKQLVEIREEVDALFRPKREAWVGWASRFSEGELASLLDQLKRAPVQHALLCRWMEYTLREGVDALLRRDFFREAGGTAAALKGLCERGVLKVAYTEVSRLDVVDNPLESPRPLSEAQRAAWEQIRDFFQEEKSVLLHGVTSSGKTEIYIHLIREVLDKGRQVLYLLPEIALTVQIVRRLRRVFGDRVGIYHSGMSDSARVEMWRKQNSTDPYPVVLGVRSSLFLPFRDLGLIIIDEEHENSYKQKEPNPRYHGRDTAMMLGMFHGANIVLGSATPSFESYRNALSGKYGLVSLNSRYGEVQMPRLIFANLQEARRKKIAKGMFTPILYDEMKRVLENGEQVILFQNRRGYATYLQCDSCGDIPKCRQCDVSMTYYKHRNMLSCHYCGALRPVPGVCQACGKGHYLERTPGTECVEEEVQQLFPQARVARMDLESMSQKSKFQHLIDRFEEGELDVLIGTQMVSKGLDFERVKLVGVMNADNLLEFPDFRAEERAYQLLMQVSGRSGRKGEQGEVVIQTSDPGKRVYRWVEQDDYARFYEALSQERELFRYPPFYRLIRVELRHKAEREARLAANCLAGWLREELGKRVCGPAVPEVSRIRGQHRIHILIKVETGLSLSKLKCFIRETIAKLAAHSDYKGVKVHVDVDAM